MKSSWLKASSTSYAGLRQSVRETLLLGQRRIEQEKVRTYWQTGKLIHEHLFHHRAHAGYGRRVIDRLAEDLDLEESLLKRSLKFFRLFPKGATWHLLTWSHYRTLLSVEDPPRRERLLSQAQNGEWTCRELEAKVREIHAREKKSSEPVPSSGAPSLLKPRLGRTGVYRIVVDGEDLAADLGFTSYASLPPAAASQFKAGDACLWKGSAPPEKVEARPSDLWTYEAEVIRVVDGDTLWMKIWLADDLFLKEKLRLRGIDAPELDTAGGRRAKAFLEERLRTAASAGRPAPCRIATTKPDKYDRYLADLFVRAPGGPVFVNQELLTHGHAVLKTRYVFQDWGDL